MHARHRSGMLRAFGQSSVRHSFVSAPGRRFRVISDHTQHDRSSALICAAFDIRYTHSTMSPHWSPGHGLRTLLVRVDNFIYRNPFSIWLRRRIGYFPVPVLEGAKTMDTHSFCPSHNTTHPGYITNHQTRHLAFSASPSFIYSGSRPALHMTEFYGRLDSCR